MALSNLIGVFAVTKLRLFLTSSLIFTWWIAHLLSANHTAIQRIVTSKVEQAKLQVPSIVVEWHPYGPRTRFNDSKVALLIEPQPISHLVPLILHMTSVVPLDWQFLFIGSPESVAFIERSPAIHLLESEGKLGARTLPPPWTLKDHEDVSRLMTDVRFYDKILPRAEWVLKYQSDSMLCANSERSLNNYLAFNWVGLGGISNDRYDGVEGLNLRRVSAVKQILSIQRRYNNSEPEHDWFMKRFRTLPGEAALSKPPVVLSVDDTNLADPMGYFVGNLDVFPWNEKEAKEKAFKFCPEVSMLMDMKLERERCTDEDEPTPKIAR